MTLYDIGQTFTLKMALHFQIRGVFEGILGLMTITETRQFMMMSSNENIFRVIGPFWGPWWNPLTKTSDAELWCSLWSAPEQTVQQTLKTQVIWDAFIYFFIFISC